MVNRSLLLKAYVYAVAALVATFALAYGTSRLLMTYGVMESYRSVGGDAAMFLAREVAASTKDGVPSAERLDDLGRSLHVGLRFVPAASDSYPVAVLEHPWVHEGDTPHEKFSYWVKVAPEGHFVGALEVQFRPPPPARGWFRWLFAGFLMVALGLIILPPLYLWVLRPLRRMVDTANRLGTDLATPVPVRRKDEFGALELAFESLRQRIQQMLAQKEQLLTDISHELRGPLSRMAIAVPLLREEGDSPYLAHIERNMQTMDHLIGELLTLSRGQTPPERDRERLDLAVMAAELLAERAMVVSQAGFKLERELEFAPIEGDRRLLERAMGNLIDNAVKYGAGTLRVETGRDGDGAVFRVTDQGPGIPAHELPLLFEPFYRPDASRSRHTGGTGLGLAIVKAVAQSHGGEALLASMPGQGTTATLRLPLKA